MEDYQKLEKIGEGDNIINKQFGKLDLTQR